MSDLLPCPFCGSGHVSGDGEGDDNWFECMACHARGPRTTFIDATDTDADRDAWNRRAANAPADPALLALARFGARVLQAGLSPAGFAVGLTWSAIGGAGEAARAIVYDKDDMARLAPGIASAIARLLAPDGAGEVTP